MLPETGPNGRPTPLSAPERRPPASVLPVLIGQLGLALLGTGVIVESTTLGLWTTLGPGPGLLPLLLGIALAGRAAADGATGSPPPDVDEDGAEPLDRFYVAVTLVSLVVMAGVIEIVGLQISMTLFLLLHLRWMGRRGWPLSIALSLVGSIGIFVLFDQVLQVPLPLSSLPALSAWGL